MRFAIKGGSSGSEAARLLPDNDDVDAERQQPSHQVVSEASAFNPSWARFAAAAMLGTMGLAAAAMVIGADSTVQTVRGPPSATKLAAAGSAGFGNNPCTGTSAPVLDGADVVAYFSGALNFGEFVEGNPQHSATLNGYTFYFESEANRARFAADPWRYAPQFGAFCSWGVARENWWTAETLAAPADPRRWQLHGGKLFIFRSLSPIKYFMGSGIADEEYNIAEGEKHWSDWFGKVPSDKSPFNTACFCSPETCSDDSDTDASR